MAEIPWQEWLDYREALKRAEADEERIQIRAEAYKKYGTGVDPDDDTVMLAGSPSEV